eukprot:m.154960 g.154960  ORF g.154960 m.154960 type:complete len:128 (-) comp16264_c1_seq7:1687-2070(-)
MKMHDPASVALFGPDPASLQRTHYLFAAITVVAVAVTIAFALTRKTVDAIHVIFAIGVILVAIPEFVLVLWYREGDLPPKFRYLIGYIMLSIVMLCCCSIVYFKQIHEIQIPCAPCHNGTNTSLPSG